MVLFFFMFSLLFVFEVLPILYYNVLFRTRKERTMEIVYCIQTSCLDREVNAQFSVCNRHGIA